MGAPAIESLAGVADLVDGSGVCPLSWKPFFDGAAGGCQPRPGFGQGESRPQPRQHAKPYCVRRLARDAKGPCERRRRPNVEAPLQFRADEVARHHAGHLQRDPVDANGAPEYARFRAEPGLPDPVAEYANRVRAFRTIVFFVDQAAERRAGAEEGEERAGNRLEANCVGVAVPLSHRGARPEADHVGEDSGLPPQFTECRVIEPGTFELPQPGLYLHDTLRVRHRQFLEQNAVNEREYGRVRANTEG